MRIKPAAPPARPCPSPRDLRRRFPAIRSRGDPYARPCPSPRDLRRRFPAIRSRGDPYDRPCPSPRDLRRRFPAIRSRGDPYDRCEPTWRGATPVRPGVRARPELTAAFHADRASRRKTRGRTTTDIRFCSGSICRIGGHSGCSAFRTGTICRIVPASASVATRRIRRTTAVTTGHALPGGGDSTWPGTTERARHERVGVADRAGLGLGAGVEFGPDRTMPGPKPGHVAAASVVDGGASGPRRRRDASACAMSSPNFQRDSGRSERETGRRGCGVLPTSRRVRRRSARRRGPGAGSVRRAARRRPARRTRRARPGCG